MTTNSWEEELCDIALSENMPKLLEFTKKLILSERSKLLKEIEEKIPKKEESFSSEEYWRGFNDCLSEVNSLLKTMRKVWK